MIAILLSMTIQYITFILFMIAVNLVIIWLFQRKFIYNPHSNQFGVICSQTPLDFSMPFKDVQVTTQDGILL